jgi:hypothetical protein
VLAVKNSTNAIGKQKIHQKISQNLEAWYLSLKRVSSMADILPYRPMARKDKK